MSRAPHSGSWTSSQAIHRRRFREWTSHPDLDAYWDVYNPSAEDYAKLEIPILTITGIYDGDQLGALEHYQRYMAASSPDGRARHYLIIGPWDHAGTRTPKDQVGGLQFGPASLMDLPQLHLDWYRWTMEDGPRPALLTKPVLYYVTGAERWRTADSLQAITAQQRSYYLDSSGGAAREVFAPGTLATNMPAGKPDSYRYDPREPTLAAVEALAETVSLLDQRVQNANPAQVVYQTAPFTQDTEISGFFQLDAYIGIDQPDTDFAVSVYEVTQAGRVIALSSDIQRARYRDSVRKPVLVKNRSPLRYRFKGFNFTSRLVASGSRIRLIVSASNSVYAQTNFNAGGIVSEESAKDGRPVTVTVFHDRQHPSTLFIPVATAEPAATVPAFFHLEPIKPVAELLPAALAAKPPVEQGDFRPADLVELTTLDPTIKLDIRYATTRNFLSTPLYSQARAFLQRPAAQALVRVQHALAKQGYGLLIHDAYRPWYVTKIFWDATAPENHKFVADPAQGSRHNRGCAVDLTLYDLKSGEPIVMPSLYDEMSERAYPTFAGGPAEPRRLRDFLRKQMQAEGFDVYEFEWWHFDYRDWHSYAIQNSRFEDLGSPR